ncbi:hypothetical protein PUN28_011288 [Cardiocondyla obscurior]|uniref:Uncharacterized protein n=1 Tax=Cardiocondyla obscurior TaxID=286306 RepID=A0AAW2FD93_9HYME
MHVHKDFINFPYLGLIQANDKRGKASLSLRENYFLGKILPLARYILRIVNCRRCQEITFLYLRRYVSSAKKKLYIPCIYFNDFTLPFILTPNLATGYVSSLFTSRIARGSNNFPRVPHRIARSDRGRERTFADTANYEYCNDDLASEREFSFIRDVCQRAYIRHNIIFLDYFRVTLFCHQYFRIIARRKIKRNFKFNSETFATRKFCILKSSADLSAVSMRAPDCTHYMGIEILV